MLAFFIAITAVASTVFPSSPSCPRTRMRSPGSNSFSAMGTASFKSFWPGSTRTSFAASCTTTLTSPLLSVVNTMLFPEIDLMVPTGRAVLEAGAPCAPNAGVEGAATTIAPIIYVAAARNAPLPFKLQIHIGKSSLPEYQDDSDDGMGLSPWLHAH